MGNTHDNHAIERYLPVENRDGSAQGNGEVPAEAGHSPLLVMHDNASHHSLVVGSCHHRNVKKGAADGKSRVVDLGC